MRLSFLASFLLLCFSSVAQSSAIDQRLETEKNIQESNFAIIPYKPNYLLPFNYNAKIADDEVYSETLDEGKQYQPVELKFQFSFKIPLLTQMVKEPFALYFGYTQVSFWQAYNSDNSSPFRETNYEPEIFGLWKKDIPLFDDWNFKFVTLNLTHQSNGQSGDISRSWNRIESKFVFEKNNLSFVISPWVRINEDSSDDDNPDLVDYYGHGSFNAVYVMDNNTLSMTARNNLESGFSRGSVEVNWSFPMGGHLRGYLQAFSGYGNSLIEYNKYTNTIGLGISLTDWL